MNSTSDTTPPLGCHDGYHGLTERQVRALLAPIEPNRVLRTDGQDHVAAFDVVAWLTKIFGFTGWDKQVTELVEVYRGVATTSKGKEVPAITYRAQVRLTIKCLHGVPIKTIEDVGTGTSPNLPKIGDAVDFAAKNAVSYAVKRCAKDLGDAFGLSLYNDGQRDALVRWTLQVPRAERAPSAEVTSLGEQEDSPVNEERQPEPEAAAEPSPGPVINTEEWGRGAPPVRVAAVHQMVEQATDEEPLRQAWAIARRQGFSPEQAAALRDSIVKQQQAISSPPGYSAEVQEAGYEGDG